MKAELVRVCGYVHLRCTLSVTCGRTYVPLSNDAVLHCAAGRLSPPPRAQLHVSCLSISALGDRKTSVQAESGQDRWPQYAYDVIIIARLRSG